MVDILLAAHAAPGKIGGRGTVVVTGGAGYIGSLLVHRLLARSYRVRVLDGLLYGDQALRGVIGHPSLELIVADLRDRNAVAAAATGADAVIHLGGLVGDPACALDPTFTVGVNEEATRTVAAACAERGVERLLFASSCSVYGASDRILDEGSALNPVSLYARTKIASERMLLETGCPTRPAPVILRFATVYGLSHRPRFDLVVNLLTAKAIAEGRITVFGGDQWRPFVHVDDIGRALVLALEAPLAKVAGQVFNVGSDRQNHRLAEVGRLVREQIPAATVVTDAASDPRNYRVSFAKIREALGFRPIWDLADGIRELKAALEEGVVPDYRDRRFDNHRFLRDALGEGTDPLRASARWFAGAAAESAA